MLRKHLAPRTANRQGSGNMSDGLLFVHLLHETLNFFIFLAVPQGPQDPSLPTRNQTEAPGWIFREFPKPLSSLKVRTTMLHFGSQSLTQLLA